MKTKIQIKSYLGNVLFEYEDEDNSIRKTVEKAHLSGADLSRADLSGADLSRADLSGADLSGAALSRADLSGADLSGADLSGADLSGAPLSGADLSGADLSGVKGLYKIIQVGPLGSRKSFLVATKEKKNSQVVLRTGCFRGSVEEFLRKVTETHKDKDHAFLYRKAVKFIEEALR